MTDFDVVIVGGRAAGSPLAAWLADSGLRTAVVDQASFPSDTPSTHLIQNVPVLRRLGVLDRLLATGAPLLQESKVNVGGVDLSVRHPEHPAICVRRDLLDEILLARAAEAGASVCAQTRVTGLVRAEGRVRGVVTRDRDGNDRELTARVVIGADGRGSTVAKMAGARQYNITDCDRPSLWRYYRRDRQPPMLHFWREGSDLIVVAPCDRDGLMVIVQPTLTERLSRASGTRAFDAALERCPQARELVAGSEPLSHTRVMPALQGFYRESAGPGWALVGDAGHFKDVATGQGIGDALRQGERLAEEIRAGLAEDRVDEALRRWWAWRDADAAGMYWFSKDVGQAGAVPVLAREVLRGLSRRETGRLALREVYTHSRSARKVFTPRRVLAAGVRSVARAQGRRWTAATEVAATVAEELRRRRLDRARR